MNFLSYRNLIVALLSALFLLLCATKVNANDTIGQQFLNPKNTIIVAEADNQPELAVKSAAAITTTNPYGLLATWQTSDGIAKVVLIMLLVMSAGSWYILVVKLLEQNKISRQARDAASKFWSADTIEQGAALLDSLSPFRYLAESATKALKTHDGLKGHIPMSDWIALNVQRAVDRIQNNAQSGLAFLATVGSIAPFVGLFGTVWGIYHALTAIGISGQASIDKVAGPIGEALIMTALGLGVAVPAVLAYNWLIRRNRVVMDDVRSFSDDLHAVVLGTLKSA